MPRPTPGLSAADLKWVGSEDDYLRGIVDAARWHGWLVHHCRPARQADGSWATPIQGDAGFPDLVLTHERSRRLLFVELKRGLGKLSDHQNRWRSALAAAGAVWRLIRVPDDYHAFLQELDELAEAPKGTIT